MAATLLTAAATAAAGAARILAALLAALLAAPLAPAPGLAGPTLLAAADVAVALIATISGISGLIRHLKPP